MCIRIPRQHRRRIRAAPEGPQCVIAGFVANRIIHEGSTLPDYKVELIAAVALLLVIVLGLLCVFAPQLNRARISGLRTYGRLASDYGRRFCTEMDRRGPQRVSLSWDRRTFNRWPTSIIALPS
jgi:hypothetical protein